MQIFLEQLLCVGTALVLGEPTGHRHGGYIFIEETDNKKNKKASHIVQEKEFRAAERMAKEREWRGDIKCTLQGSPAEGPWAAPGPLLGSPAVRPPPRYIALLLGHVSFLVTILILIIELSSHSNTTSTQHRLFHSAVRRQGMLLELLERAVTATGREDELMSLRGVQ